MLPSQGYRCLLSIVRYQKTRTGLRTLDIDNQIGLINLLQTRNSQSSHPSDHQGQITRIGLRQRIAENLQDNLKWFNEQYERSVGIAEIRDTQVKVIEAEQNFVNTTQRRKYCQDRIETVRGDIKNIRDNLDTSPRQSENYLKLVTEEHKLHVELSQLKEAEQLALDYLSRLLRQSHELERLRQERSKYLQIISISFSLAGSLIALIVQRSRNQNSIGKQLVTIDKQLACIQNNVDLTREDSIIVTDQLKRIQLEVGKVTRALSNLSSTDLIVEQSKQQQVKQSDSWISWTISWIPSWAKFGY